MPPAAAGATCVLWDIDGTLIDIAGAGVLAWRTAQLDVFGTARDVAELRPAGWTDAQVATGLVLALGEDRARDRELLHRFEQLLPGCLARRPGRVLPMVREVLAGVDAEPGAINLLLTGNGRVPARAKLERFALWSHFGGGGGFSELGSDRGAIARRARQRAHAIAGTGCRLVVIGDTPHDVECGVAIGAQTIAIATGPGYTLEDLRATHPTHLLAQLPTPGRFLELLGCGRDP